MSLGPDGAARCDGCGNPVGNGSIAVACVATYMTQAGEAVQVHWCLAGCAPRVLAEHAKALPADLAEQGVWVPPEPADG